MSPRSHDWRAILGAPVLLAGSVAGGGRLADVLLVVGATLLASAAAAPRPAAAGAGVPRRRTHPARWAYRVRRRPSTATLALSAAALCCAAGAGVLLLSQRDRSGVWQVTNRSADPTVTAGRIVPASRDSQLHIVAPRAPFILGAARITVSAAQTCAADGSTLISVPVSLAAASKGAPTDPPSFQLLDARLDPYDPAAIATPSRPRGSVAHAAPPPTVLREQVEFSLPSSQAGGVLHLDAQRPSGVGPIYRVLVSGSQTSPPTGGSATCPHPGGAA